MDYQTSSRSQKKPSRTSSSNHSSPLRHSTPITTESASLRYFTAANPPVPYESPYAQNIDRQSRPPSDSTFYASSRSTSINPALTVPSPLPASTSPYSSSSGESLYRSSPTPPNYRQNRSGTMSSSRTMSAVSHILKFIAIFDLVSGYSVVVCLHIYF